MSNTLSGRRVAFVVAPEGVEQVELTEPWKAVTDAGGQPELVSTNAGEVQAFNHLDKADTFPVDKVVTDVSDHRHLRGTCRIDESAHEPRAADAP